MKYLDDILEKKNIKPQMIHALSLAFLGDAIHSLYMRYILVCDKDFKQKDLQAKTSSIVCAINQAKAYDYIFADLRNDELDIAGRARNAKTNNIAKNATIEQYKKSTAFEALLGYEYLKNDIDRLKYFLDIACKVSKSEKE